MDQLLHPNFNQEALKKANVIATGLAASPGAATGKIYFAAEDVMKAHENGEKEMMTVAMATIPKSSGESSRARIPATTSEIMIPLYLAMAV